MSRHSALSANGVVKSFSGTPVLAGMSIEVPAGSLTAVLGPSGCGKTTLLRLIAGFEHVDAGEISVLGTVMSAPGRHVPAERRRLGYVAQEGALFPHLDVAANVAFGLPRARRRAGRVQELLDLLDLAGLARRMPHELSGGQQQRVALARALAPAPALLLLDEPFDALDAGLRAGLRSEVCAALRAAGATTLLVTHDQEEALSLADLVAVVRDKRIVQAADPATLYREPADPAVARFVGEAVLLPARLEGGRAHCALGRLPVLGRPRQSGPATAMIRPEQILLGAEAAEVSARVLATTYYGHDASVRLAVAAGDGEDCQVIARVEGHACPAVGQAVRLAVDGEIVAYPEQPPPRTESIPSENTARPDLDSAPSGGWARTATPSPASRSG